MLKYTGKYWLILAPLVRKSLKKHYDKAFAVNTMIKAKWEYQAMLERVDDIGADNPMASNIYMSFVFFAVYKAANEKITIKALRNIAHEAISWKPLRLMGVFLNANKPSGINSIRKMMMKNAEWLEKHPKYKKVSWDFNFDENKHRDGYYYHFTQCPLNNFARGCELRLRTSGFLNKEQMTFSHKKPNSETAIFRCSRVLTEVTRTGIKSESPLSYMFRMF